MTDKKGFDVDEQPVRELAVSDKVASQLVKRMFEECGSYRANEFARRVSAGEHDVSSPWQPIAEPAKEVQPSVQFETWWSKQKFYTYQSDHSMIHIVEEVVQKMARAAWQAALAAQSGGGK